MQNTWFLGVVALVAIGATGCAGDNLTVSMESSGVAIEPIGGGLVTASPDQGLPRVAPGLIPGTDAVDHGDTAIAAIPSCPTSAPSAVSMAAAQPLGECARGSLVDADVGQHFVFTALPGVSYVLRVGRAGDARFDLGVVTTTAEGVSVCTALSTGLVATRVTVDPSAGPLCAVVHSESGAAQEFQLTLTRW